VVKKLLDSNLEARKLLLKEARLINQLNHANIVEFKGICIDRYQRHALLMEYVCFDFRPIGHDLIVHNLICSGYNHHHHHHQSILFKMKKHASLAQLKADLQEGRDI
jgi:serine/threonine protein kinase